MKNKKRILSTTNIILEYRIPVYNYLSDYFDVTVAHYGKEIYGDNIKFRQIILTKKAIGPFTYFKENIHKLANQYDAVIALGDLHILPYVLLGFRVKRKYSLTYWSIGVSASYNKRFDEDRRLDKIRFFLMNRADSIVFYTSYPIKRYVEDGNIKKDKLFVANNTVEVKEKIELPKSKKYFLFVGTLYRAKKIFDLLDAYNAAYIDNKNIYPLVIIGDGEERSNIEEWIKKNKLTNKISLTGSIYNQDELKKYYKEAIACISPGQAGLTVLNSMAYGVPFVTTENAITGGEIFNIDNNVNSIIYKEGLDNLKKNILQLSENSNNLIYAMSKKAQEYYFTNRTIDIMVNGLKDSINYALHKRNKN